MPRLGSIALDHDLAEDVATSCRRRRRAMPACPRHRAASASRSPLVAVNGRQQVDAGVAREGFGHGQPLRLGERIDGAAAKATRSSSPVVGGRQPQQRGAVVHQHARRARRARYHSSMVNSGACSAPRSRLRKTRAKSKIRAFARRQQLFQREFRRGVQVAPIAGAVGRDQRRSRRRADASRCRARLAGRGSRPRGSPARSK